MSVEIQRAKELLSKVENLEEKGEKLPYLLQYYKDDCKMSDTSDDITKRYNENNNLTDEQNKLLKAKLFE